MKFIITHDFAPEHFNAVVDHFIKGKEKIPKGMKMLGRWHSACHGWTLAEADDLGAIYRFTDQWENLIRFKVTPVIDDTETAAIIASR